MSIAFGDEDGASPASFVNVVYVDGRLQLEGGEEVRMLTVLGGRRRCSRMVVRVMTGEMMVHVRMVGGRVHHCSDLVRVRQSEWQLNGERKATTAAALRAAASGLLN